MQRLRVPSLALVLGSVALLAAALPVEATTILGEHYADDYAFSYSCGAVTVEVAGQVSGVAHIRVGQGPDDDAFFLHDNYAWEEVHTASTGEVLVISANGVFQETRATRLEGSVFEFSSINAGQPFVVRDGDGNLLLRDRGVIRETIIFDTLGDDEPGGELIESVAFNVAGPHPGLIFDTCSVLG